MREGEDRARVWWATGYLLGTLASVVLTVPLLPLLGHPAVLRRWAAWHERRAGRLCRVAVPTHRIRPRRALGWLPAHLAIGLPAGAVALVCLGNLLLAAVVTPLWWAFPVGDPARLVVEVPVTGWATALTLGPVQVAGLAAVAYWGFPRLATAHARVCLAVLAPSAAERLADRIAVLTRTRADVLEAHGAELRRIERDLHDGTQARLVTIAIRLAVARDRLPGDPEAVAELLREAHEGTEEAMTELREVIRTIYPPVLADQGLAGALRTVVARSGVPAELEVGELAEVPVAVQAVAYFAVTEGLSNVARHGRADRALVRVSRQDNLLRVTVVDDGIGGADERGGSGLAGIRRRAAALDGAVTVRSPAGGPTEITVELPCGW
ncbi:histidine kinase [Micromonospora sp. WMMD1102]|uniref:sensor histidine kinase n=1 Tax=Micromonospora sp. WMMD1102 TaxID=3016105 RepID=UPI0024152A0F|nr:sensor histidine kinase [Micromonospora sp. WMMD1102]MDG4784792.1 histidine kinase [Micromonospora sp. WMMD1102]